jgi:uncharacterized protein Yka (UPF0111/DUF47 family)
MPIRLFPRNEEFFDLFDESAARIVEVAKAFQALLRDPPRFRENARAVKELEHQTDKVTHRALEMLYSTYLTPIDREDIHALVTRLDDVVDYIDACAQRFVMFGIETVPEELIAQAQVLVLMTERLQLSIKGLREMKKVPAIKESLIELSRLENEGDLIFRQVLAKLIATEKDAVRLIVKKELHEITEAALDKCSSVGHVVEAIILKHG